MAEIKLTTRQFCALREALVAYLNTVGPCAVDIYDVMRRWEGHGISINAANGTYHLTASSRLAFHKLFNDGFYAVVHDHSRAAYNALNRIAAQCDPRFIADSGF